MEEQNVITALAALAQPTRLRVFRWLVVAGRDGATPGTIAAALGLPAATLSFHLKELRTAGLIEQERRGRQLVYRTDYARMDDLLRYLTDNCCQGQPCLPATADPARPARARTEANAPDVA
jgi:DNA-binding transcriptional ArsR family regulator